MPLKLRECMAVGVEPAETIGQAIPAARNLLGGGDDRRPLLLRDGGDAVDAALVIGMTAVRHHARQLDAGRRMQHARDVEQAGQLGIGQAGAAGAAVDLDEHRECVPVRRRVGDRPGDHQVVGDDAQVDALRRSSVTAASFEGTMPTA
jgi:hypothetical protein